MSDDRLADLERRVAALEERLAPAVSTGPDPDTFWALEGLRNRVEEPGAVLITGHVTLPDGRVAQWQEGAAVEELLGADWSEQVAALTALGHPVRVRLLKRVLTGAA